MILLDLNCNSLFNIQIFLCFIPQRTTFCPKRRISDSFSTMLCVLYWDFEVPVTSHTCKTKVSRVQSKAEIPSRPSRGIYSAPVVARCKRAIKFMSLQRGLVKELRGAKKRGESQASLNHRSGETSPSLLQLSPQKWEESRLPTAIQTSSYFLRVPGTCLSIHNPQQVKGNRIIMNASADV